MRRVAEETVEADAGAVGQVGYSCGVPEDPISSDKTLDGHETLPSTRLAELADYGVSSHILCVFVGLLVYLSLTILGMYLHVDAHFPRVSGPTTLLCSLYFSGQEQQPFCPIAIITATRGRMFSPAAAVHPDQNLVPTPS